MAQFINLMEIVDPDLRAFVEAKTAIETSGELTEHEMFEVLAQMYPKYGTRLLYDANVRRKEAAMAAEARKRKLALATAAGLVVIAAAVVAYFVALAT